MGLWIWLFLAAWFSVGFPGIVNSEPHAGMADLPPLLEFSNGTRVTGMNGWLERRAEMRDLLSTYYYGTVPDDVPALLSHQEYNVTHDRGIRRSYVQLMFNTSNKASFSLEMLAPEDCTSAQRCPLFMTQTNHRRWALIGVSRGYVAAVYPGADSNDQSDGFRLAYPKATWGLIRRRAWLASRALDYLVTLEMVESTQVCLTGHSRNGKQSMIAAAYDERFTAVISSSSGAPAMSPYRFTSAYTFSEDPYGPWPNAPHELNCSCVRDTSDQRPLHPECCWWLPEVEKWAGYENQLPIDSHALLGLIAPRFMLSECADNDPCDPSYAVERAYFAGKKAYQFLNAEDHLRIHWRPGDHHGYELIDNYFDWFDVAFQRAGAEVNDLFPEKFHHYFNWTAWNSSSLTKHEPSPASEELTTRVLWLQGQAPAGPGWSPGGSYAVDYQVYVEDMEHKGAGTYMVEDGVAKMTLSFGRYIVGDLYFPSPLPSKALPAVVWLHPYSYQDGYTENYPKDSHRMSTRLASEGFVVLSYDQLGFGRRLHEGIPDRFYRRWPNWSRFGHLVQDVSSAIDALLGCRDGPFPDGLPVSHTAPRVDQHRVVVAGYSLGAAVALHTALLDERVTGVAALAGISPLRNDTLARQTGGNRRLFEWHALLPRLGWFQSREHDVPYDYDELLLGLKGRAALLYSPTDDRTVDRVALEKCIHNVQAYAQSSGTTLNLDFLQPQTTNKLDNDMQDALLSWLKKV